MIKKLMIILASFFAFFGYAQNDDHQLYDHELDENKWNKIRDNIRYEGHDRNNSAGRQWTYESSEEYEKAQKGKGGGRNGGGGNGTGGPGSGASEKPQEYDRSPPRSSPPSVSAPSFGGMSVLGYIMLGVFILALAFLIYYLFVNAPKKGKEISSIEEELENVNPTEILLTELQRMLQEALGKGDYRGAVRIYFIFIIRDLADKNWIKWEKEKTNFHYLREMSGKQLFDDFNKSVSYFEVIWYGKRELDENKFKQVKPNFTNLLDKLGVK